MLNSMQTAHRIVNLMERSGRIRDIRLNKNYARQCRYIGAQINDFYCTKSRHVSNKPVNPRSHVQMSLWPQGKDSLSHVKILMKVMTSHNSTHVKSIMQLRK